MFRGLSVLLLALLCAAPVAAAEVRVLGLFKGAALLQVNGKQQLLREGQHLPPDIRLISADPNRAILMIEGQRRIMQLSDEINASYRAPARYEVTIPRNMNREYRTRIAVNGYSIDAVVDTGANIVALSSQHARAIGLDYRNGHRMQVGTASGMSLGYRISLNRIELGGIIVQHVPAVVIEGGFPRTLLLGMSFLEHVNMEESSNILTLRQAF